MLAPMNLIPVSRPTISSLWAKTSHLPLGKQLFSRLLPSLRLIEGQELAYTRNISFRGPLSLEVEWDERK